MPDRKAQRLPSQAGPEAGPEAGPSRRALLGAASLAALAALPRATRGETPAARDAAKEPAKEQAKEPVKEPAKEPASEPEPRVLSAGTGKARLKPAPARGAAPETPVWCFDGRTEPPVVRIRHGDPVRLRLDNRTDKPLSLHWHGVRNRNAMDGVGGVTQPPVAPGASFTYAFTPPDAGTSLIRPLVVGGASEPSGRGLAGLLVVEERAPPAVEQDLAVLLQDWRLEEDGTLMPFGQPAFAAASGRLGNCVTVNGRPIPDTVEVRPGSRLRLRLANACNARATRIRFDGAKAYVVAVDGQPTDTFEPLRATLPFPPGTRYDLLLDMLPEPNATVTVNALIGSGMVLAKIVAKGEPVTEKRAPIGPIGDNKLLPAEVKLQNAVRRDVVLSGGARLDKDKPGAEPAFTGDPARIWQVNGVTGAVGAAPAFSVKKGQVVVLAIRNETGFTQAVHLHGHVFRLLHPLDDGWEPYWLDTFQIIEGKTVRIAFLADNPGRWLISSTVLERFDTGLWTSFEVT